MLFSFLLFSSFTSVVTKQHFEKKKRRKKKHTSRLRGEIETNKQGTESIASRADVFLTRLARGDTTNCIDILVLENLCFLFVNLRCNLYDWTG